MRDNKGFTLIELLIVVVIIGILAAIAIPNFLQYQLKSRQSEAKENLQAIKTSMISFQAEQGCYLGIATEGVIAPASAVKVVPYAWGIGLPATPSPVAWCVTGGIITGFFNDVGFRPAGNVNYNYSVDAVVLAGAGAATTYHPAGLNGAANSCTAAIAGASGAGIAGANNFYAHAKSNLDGDSVGPTSGISTWTSTVDHGSWDCTTGVY